jgi:hypothetical protein
MQHACELTRNSYSRQGGGRLPEGQSGLGPKQFPARLSPEPGRVNQDVIDMNRRGQCRLVEYPVVANERNALSPGASDLRVQLADSVAPEPRVPQTRIH